MVVFSTIFNATWEQSQTAQRFFSLIKGRLEHFCMSAVFGIFTVQSRVRFLMTSSLILTDSDILYMKILKSYYELAHTPNLHDYEKYRFKFGKIQTVSS